jgi:crotonobetainyl-CoA:carnitine CoA-transferase CaiB-like acyl-CoA transferase
MDLLEGVRVVSFNHFLLGPMGAQFLADLGADVVMVEPPQGAFQRHWSAGNRYVDGDSLTFLCANRNKRSVALDLKQPDGVEVARRLVAGADVVMENFRPGVMDRLGLGYEAVRELNPRVVYASASGWGSSGPYAERPGQDLLLQAFSGLMQITGDDASPPCPVGVSAADHHGAMTLAAAILGALVRQQRTGRGARVEVDLLSAALDLQAESLAGHLNGDRSTSLRPPAHIGGWYFPAPYGVYRASDGHLAISLCALDRLARALECEALSEFSDDDAWSRRDAIARHVQEAVARRSLAEWEARLTEHGVWHAPVNDYAALERDPQVKHSEMLRREHLAGGTPVTLVSHPARYDGERPRMRRAPPPVGAHTREVLGELGYEEGTIERLGDAGAIRCAPEQADRE